jgi:hypothetical protein
MRSVSEKKTVRENQNTYFMFNNCPPEIPAVEDTRGRSVVEPDGRRW